MELNVKRVWSGAFALVIMQQTGFAAGAGGAGLPWENPINMIARSLSGPVALGISIIALAVAGGMLVFDGHLSDLGRRACVTVLAISFLVAGNSFMATLFGVAGAVI